MTPHITVAEYPPSRIEEHYHPTRNAGRSCVLCFHYSAARDLRNDKRYIVPLEDGECKLNKKLERCNSFEKIQELRGKNMSVAEKMAAHHYTRKFMTKVVRWYFNDQNAKYNRCFHYEFYAKMICNYIKSKAKG